ncbi:ATP-binding cassette domain-containing protein [Corynebacterium sp. H128]|uniref:energy-coupling factor ABC transporter ATP-binding protein n=1 Tax=unclassified Corynebacterium TaxID=2624378 RepID=UPI0030A8128C
MSVLETHAVHFAHDEPVLSGVTMDVAKGERLAILGANGSGKSTLLKLLAGSWRPDSGRVLLDGSELDYSRRGRDHMRRNVQLVLQEPDEQIFATSVSADVSYGPVNLGLSTAQVSERVAAALERCEISHLADRVPHQLSYGQRKQVALAGALAMQPRVLLLDEPTAGLDPYASERLLATLLELNAAGTTVVISTHEVDFAYAFATSVGLLSAGELLVGSPDLLSDVQKMHAARLCLPWAPLVSGLVGRDIVSAEQLL